MRLKLENLTFVIEEYFEPFIVDGYTFLSKYKTKSKDQIKTHQRQHKHNAFVEFRGEQKDSIIFKGGQVNFRNRKLIEDILLLGSLLTGRNWSLYLRKVYPFYPAVSSNHLDYICRESNEIEPVLNKGISKIDDINWQIQYENGFHLIMLLNNANILKTESRFLSNVIIWEWLYPHLKNPSGATSKDESFDLTEIFNYILGFFWESKLNSTIFNSKYKNIFYCLRNQLSHSGKIPINRDYAEPWMKDLQWDPIKGKGIKDYIDFFSRLTQVVVLKTLDIDAEENLKIWNFSKHLDLFLNTGKIS